MVRVLVGLVVLLGAMSQRAEACSCISSPFLFSGAGVPLNARLPVLGAFNTSANFELSTDGGTLVASRTEVVPGGVIVIPDEPLAPSTDYALSFEAASNGPIFFRTSDEADQVAPSTPSISSFTHFVSPALGRSTCDLGGDGFTLTLSGFVSEPFTFFEVFTGTATDRIDTTKPALLVPAGASFFLGDASVCEHNLSTSTMSDLAVQVRTVDAAGNASALSNAVQLKRGGCSSTGGPALGLGGLLLLALRNGPKRRRITPVT
jgi:hypothetical protein